MGAWGVEINDNDTYLDIKGEFLDMYNENVPIDKIYEHFLKYIDFNNIEEDTQDFWFAILDLLWQC
jgi:hypothetical protein